MLSIISHEGFHMQFSNGWTASVQFGPATYSEHHNDSDFDAPRRAEKWASSSAEVAAWPQGGGELVALEQDGDNVRGWLSANQVLVFLNWVAGAEHSLDDLNRFLCQELEETKE